MSQFKPFRRVAVLGAGVMGSQIAALLASVGLQVDLLDIPAEGENKNAIVEAGFKRLRKMKPTPFYSPKAARRIRLGNFEEHWDRLREADWIIEAVIERLDIKRDLMAKVEKVARRDAIISTNTSGLPLHQIVQGRRLPFRRRFLGTHFFNPPRYLKLLELIPTKDTRQDVLERMAWFGRMVLGKGIVIAKDTPNFIANRIGVFTLMHAVQAALRGEYTIQEVDLLTGKLIGRPKSATFRTADLVGLDTLLHVLRNLYENVPHDESREMFKPPEVLERMVEKGLLGDKVKAGFYKKMPNGEIWVINFETLEYEPPKEPDLPGLDKYKKIADLDERLRALYADEGRIGAFLRSHFLTSMAYSARRIPEITERPADVDRAMRWGFGWTYGPFQTWDALGFERVLADMQAVGEMVPEWVTQEMPAKGAKSFYLGFGPEQKSYVYGQGYQDDAPPHDEIPLAYFLRQKDRHIWSNSEVTMVDIGDGVALLEFHSKGNTLGRTVLEGFHKAMDIVGDGDFRGLVIANDGENFCLGANLLEILMSMENLDEVVKEFQQTMQRIRYFHKPIVVAVHGRVLGGGVELMMASPHPVAAAESYIGLVEVGVGLIPAGTGTTRMVAWAAESAANERPNEVQAFLAKAFEQIAMAKVAMSAVEAQEMGYLPKGAVIVTNTDRRVYVAKQEVIRLYEEGYTPPPYRNAIYVLGPDARAAFMSMAYNMLEGRYITEYEYYLAERLAFAMTGGDLVTGPSYLTEDQMLDLERRVFLELAHQPKTQERMWHILKYRKPLRN
ncbi:MAG: 3-hydroxyacyl-CoA dehydrogenase/enoyl-CoA hydratase family protein [Chloroflexi bacterium]|nr:3-hydroxyacyl-CoA dehydrogenase/enoyl-CoA hydratase family protein [Chloroflexota bacterium]